MGDQTFGEKLKALRERSDKTQTEVVQEILKKYPDCRMSQASYSALEQRVGAPRQNVLDILVDYFQVSYSHFYNDQGAAHPIIAAYRQGNFNALLELLTNGFESLEFQYSIVELEMLDAYRRGDKERVVELFMARNKSE